MNDPLGIYIHIPFCSGKCPYCDFYSVPPEDGIAERYCDAVCRELEACERSAADTIYFGGGTPTLLGSRHLSRILHCITEHFDITPDAEITFEMNPRTADRAMLSELRKAGFNRVSMGLQSGVDSELAALGRRHTLADARKAAEDIRCAGFNNLSLDLMLGIPGQTPDSLALSMDAVCAMEPEHISAYILKIEPGTPFAARQTELDLADDDGQAELYSLAVKLLESRGYKRYEISNFSRPGRESRHNLRYWDCREYLGFGPSAHSFYRGRRFFFPRALQDFLDCAAAVDDGSGGSREEYLMLRLRLAEGVTNDGWQSRFGEAIPQRYLHRAEPLVALGLMEADGKGIRLCGEGFLLSNAVIARLLDD